MLFFSKLKTPLAWLLLCWGTFAFSQQSSSPVFSQYLAECAKPAEFFGIFLANQKVGYMSSSCGLLGQNKAQLRMETHVLMRVVVGSKEVSREVRQVDIYEAKPQGKLLNSTLTMEGDGGNQKLHGQRKGGRFEVSRERPGMPMDQPKAPEVLQTLEDANMAFFSFLQKAPLQGHQWDWTELKNHRMETKIGKTKVHFMGGISTTLQEVVQISAKDNIHISYWFDEAGGLREVEMAPGLRALAEAEEVAKSWDKVDIFNLVRVVLPRALSVEELQTPSALNYVLKGFPQELVTPSARQQFGPLKDGLQNLRVEARQPQNTDATFPLADPEGGKNLTATSQIESGLPAVLKLGKKIVGKEKNAWAAAKKINRWVFQNVKKGYGISADTTQQILKQMEGDCTEHSLLAVSLLRSLGIPARRVNGLVYAPQAGDAVPALYWHQWTEVYIGEWVEMDPTFNEEVASVGHIALGKELETHMVQGFGQIRVVGLREEKLSP
ncbi:MAG: transglutaminase-like domain-containing protein [Cystobacterineae bacterium]|nr:transglutaminase-like domain-containing protein [Cystobacterineae bacterium]